MGFLVAQLVKNPPAMQETCVQSLGGEDPLEKEMATHSSILAWESPWKRRLEGYNPWGLQRVPGIMEKHLFYVHFASCQYDKNK